MPKLYETITAENWVKEPAGFYGTSDTRGCILGHLSQLVLDWQTSPEYEALWVAARILFPDRLNEMGKGPRGIGAVNDHPDTTLEDIIRLCKVADV